MLELVSPNMKILFNPILKTPINIEYIIDPFKRLKGGRRSFIYDPRIPKDIQISPDFNLRGYSRGHLVPSFIMSWDKTINGPWVDTYKMTNIAIQDIHFNSGNWNKLEKYIYTYAKKNNIILKVITGISLDGDFINNQYFISKYFYTTIRNDYDTFSFLGENNRNGKIWKVKDLNSAINR